MTSFRHGFGRAPAGEGRRPRPGHQDLRVPSGIAPLRGPASVLWRWTLLAARRVPVS